MSQRWAQRRRDDDEEQARALLGAVIPASQIRHQGVEQAARRILEVADRADLVWPYGAFAAQTGSIRGQ